MEVAVYTTDFHMLYHDAIDNDIVKENPEMIAQILQQKEIEFYIGKYQAVGMVYPFNGQTYIVTAAAYDGYGHTNLLELQKTLVILFFIGLLLLFITCYFLVRASLKPIREIVKEAETITASHIDQRLPVRNEKDELGELSQAFNELLERLEISFNSQKMFVSNVSHEMRTPLAALIAELDLCLQKDRTETQYRQAMQNVLQDARRMTKLIDGLLNLAKADYQKEQIKMHEIRLDELLLDTREIILRAHPEYHIELIFEQEDAEDDRMITVMGNDYLLNIAFANLIENNCKYSDDKSSFIQISYWDKWTIIRLSDLLNIAFANLIENNCKYSDDKSSFIQISYWDKWTIIRLSDDGIGMSDAEKEKIFTLFYRGEQEQHTEGHGIGMALAQKIITLHQGSIAVHSKQGEGTTFIIELPHI